MALRKKQEGKLVVEQTRDLGVLRAMLSGADMITEGLEWPPACYLVAYFGTEPVGVIGVEPSLDAALLRSLYVVDAMRRHGIGAGAGCGGAQSGAYARCAIAISLQH